MYKLIYFYYDYIIYHRDFWKYIKLLLPDINFFHAKNFDLKVEGMLSDPDLKVCLLRHLTIVKKDSLP